MPNDATPLTQDHARRLGRWVGILYIITFASAIPALLLFQPVLDDTRYVLGGGQDNQIAFAALLELILIVANIATAVVLYPLVRKRFPVASLAYVAARIMECVFIAVGILSLLTIVTLRTEAADSDAVVAVAEGLVALKDWTFLLGPGFVVGIGNGLILAWMMYRSGLVPRGLAIVGLVGGAMIVLSGTLVLFGVIDQGGVWQGVATIPEFIWELSFGIYLAVTGGRTAMLFAKE
ncbi:MAG: hypothetical protein JWM90_3110 [Thermoleophilia bacterium]|nr:hypothetical protein [Thermoleophilia bacterium]